MRFERKAGILLHPTCLPGRFGIGDLGPSAFLFIEQLARAGQTYWQTLPLGPTGYGDSPYQSLSAFAGNTLLISPERLADDGLIDRAELDDIPELDKDRVDYSTARAWKRALLIRAFARFREAADVHYEFDQFCAAESYWLDDYSLYRAIKSAHDESAWFQWPDELKFRDPTAIARARADLGQEIYCHKFCQFVFFRQLQALREHAASHGVKMIGDLPIFVALDSVDVWVNREQFKLNSDGSPTVVSGVPPDYFSKTGQLWGNPICDWQRMQTDGFAWWLSRFRHALKMSDVVRIDHFRGFVASWEVPGKDETAENGQWVNVPGRELFSALRSELGDLPAIAEDLGAITPEVEALRDEFDFPGMRIFEYGFGGDAHNRDLPHNYEAHTVAYTGTHDNDTVTGWFAALDESTRSQVVDYLDMRDSDPNWAMVRALYASVADTVMLPAQDVLGLSSDARMNTPATTEGNWRWRMTDDALTEEILDRLAKFSTIYGRS